MPFGGVEVGWQVRLIVPLRLQGAEGDEAVVDDPCQLEIHLDRRLPRRGPSGVDHLIDQSQRAAHVEGIRRGRRDVERTDGIRVPALFARRVRRGHRRHLLGDDDVAQGEGRRGPGQGQAMPDDVDRGGLALARAPGDEQVVIAGSRREAAADVEAADRQCRRMRLEIEILEGQHDQRWPPRALELSEALCLTLGLVARRAFLLQRHQAKGGRGIGRIAKAPRRGRGAADGHLAGRNRHRPAGQHRQRIASQAGQPLLHGRPLRWRRRRRRGGAASGQPHVHGRAVDRRLDAWDARAYGDVVRSVGRPQQVRLPRCGLRRLWRGRCLIDGGDQCLEQGALGLRELRRVLSRGVARQEEE